MFRTRITADQNGEDPERDLKIGPSINSKDLVKLFEEIAEFGKAKQFQGKTFTQDEIHSIIIKGSYDTDID